MSRNSSNGNTALYQSRIPRPCGDQKQDLATFGTRAQACTTRKTSFRLVQVSVLLYRCRNQIFLGGRDRGERRFSPGLDRTVSHRFARVNTQPSEGYWEICTYIEILLWSHESLHDGEHDGNPSQFPKAMALGKPEIQDSHARCYSGSRYFSNPENELSLTYVSLIDGGFGVGCN